MEAVHQRAALWVAEGTLAPLPPSQTALDVAESMGLHHASVRQVMGRCTALEHCSALCSGSAALLTGIAFGGGSLEMG